MSLAAALVAAGCQSQERTDLHEGRRPNRLVHEKSPYLLQHAYNPVDWYPWGDEAFARARQEDKPIFLSVGYSTCHWCHVMERESFENATLAESLNAWFVPVKVDREERPDVDRVYMNAAFALTGGGGWPLSVFLTPEGKPFYAGTYFPPTSRGGRPGFLELLRGIHEAWAERREQVSASADELAQAIERAVRVEPDTAAVALADVRRLAYEHLAGMYDERRGGFGGAPKFPQPSYFSFLFRRWAATGDARARDMALATLDHMARGGIHDQLGGGFHRYSTDADWLVPHFEKMLYDQAQLARAYVEAYEITREPAYADVARDVLDYVARDLTSPEGAFYSAEDADSPDAQGRSEEGAFYVWTAAEIESVLGKERAAAFAAHYGVTPEGNFEHGQNVLHATAGQLTPELEEDRRRLLAAREKRPRPHRDDKVLASWNGLMISAYALAASALEEPGDLARARKAADFAWAKLWDERTRTLRRRYRDGEAAIPGELSDYAFLAQGYLDLFEAGFDERDLERALALTDRQIELFWDETQGGFFDTAPGSDPHLFARGKEAHDGAEPSGNSVAVANLARLARLADRDDLEHKARRTLDLFASHVSRSPLALTQLWGAGYLLDGKSAQVVIAGRPGDAETRKMIAAARRGFAPGRVVLLADGGEGQKRLAARLPYLAGVKAVEGRATAYLCENFTCGPPTHSLEELTRRLGQATAHAAIP